MNELGNFLYLNPDLPLLRKRFGNFAAEKSITLSDTEFSAI